MSVPTNNISNSIVRLTALAKNLMDVFAGNSGNPGNAGYAAQVGQMAYTTTRGTILAVHAGTGLAGYFNKVAPIIDRAEVVVQRVSPFLTRLAVPVTIGAGIIKAADHIYKGDYRDAAKVGGFTAGTLAGAFAGAAAGGALGSVVPILGTGIGMAVGGVVGSLGGGAVMKEAVGAAYDVITANPVPQLAPG